MPLPMGIVDAPAPRLHPCAQDRQDIAFRVHPDGALLLAALLLFPLWKGAYHVRSLLIDFGGEEWDGIFGEVLCLVTIVGSVVVTVAVEGVASAGSTPCEASFSHL